MTIIAVSFISALIGAFLGIVVLALASANKNSEEEEIIYLRAIINVLSEELAQKEEQLESYHNDNHNLRSLN